MFKFDKFLYSSFEKEKKWVYTWEIFPIEQKMKRISWKILSDLQNKYPLTILKEIFRFGMHFKRDLSKKSNDSPIHISTQGSSPDKSENKSKILKIYRTYNKLRKIFLSYTEIYLCIFSFVWHVYVCICTGLYQGRFI